MQIQRIVVAQTLHFVDHIAFNGLTCKHWYAVILPCCLLRLLLLAAVRR